MSDEPRKTVLQPYLSGVARGSLVLFVLCYVQLGAEEPSDSRSASEDRPSREISVIEIGSSIEAVLEADDRVLPGKGRYRSFRLLSKEAGTITIRLESAYFDADLLVRDKEGNSLAQDALNGPGDGAQLVLEIEAAKAYEVLALSATKHGAGTFKLEVRSGRAEKLSRGEELERDRAWYEGLLELELSKRREARLDQNLADCYYYLGYVTKAGEEWKKALALFREVKDRWGEGEAVGGLGTLLLYLGQAEKAREYYDEALAIHREVKNRRGEGKALRDLGNAHEALGELEKAREHYDQALTLSRQLKDHRSESYALQDLGLLHGRLGETDKAIGYCEQAVRISREAEDRWAEGISLESLGQLYKGPLRRPEKALSYFKRALEIHREVRNGTGEGSTLGNLGFTYFLLHQLEKARDCSEQALAIHRERNPTNERANLMTLGFIYRALGQPERTRVLWGQALSVAREAKDRRNEALTLNFLGGICEDLGRFKEARDHWLQALPIFQELKDVRNEGNVLGRLGNVSYRLDEPKQAIDYYEQVLVIALEMKDQASKDWTNAGIAAGRLAHVYMHAGQPEKAFGYYEQALPVYRELGLRLSEAEAVGQLGAIYYDFGQTKKALVHFTQALEILSKTTERAAEATILRNLGAAYYRLSQPDKARVYAERALSIFRELKDREGEAHTLGGVGLAFNKLGQPAKAIKHIENALVIDRELGTRIAEARDLQRLAFVYKGLGQPEEAIKYYKQALTICDDVGGGIGSFALWELGSLHFRQGRLRLAHDHYRRAHAIETAVIERAEQSIDESIALSLLEEAEPRAALYLELLVRLYREAKSGSERDAILSEALELVEFARARTLMSSMRAADYRHLLSLEGQERWDRLRALKTERSKLTVEMLKRVPKGEAARTSAVKKLESVRAGLDERITSLERKLKTSEPKLAAILPGRGEIDSASLARILGEREVLLHYNLIGGKQLVIFTADARGALALHTIDLDADFAAQIEQTLAALISPGTKGEPTPLPELKKSLQALGRKVLGGLEKRLEGAEGLVVVPDGDLHFLPFETLVLDDGKYLIERYRVRYAPSIHVLLELRRRNSENAAAELVLYGDPEFGKAPDEPAGQALAMRLRGGDDFTKLEHAAAEIDRIEALFKKKIVRRDGAATESQFKEESRRGTVLHVATHGRLAVAPGSTGQALFYSGLAFSGVNGGGDGQNDGFLTAAEVAALDLRSVNLAVLSACQTASGVVRGHEGKFGLERSFFVAGVRTYVGSLWRVDDQATSDFMASWYRYMQGGLGKSEALRRVKLDFASERLSKRKGGAATRDGERGVGLTPKRARVLSHPYYWAPFILSGDGAGMLER